LDRKRSGDFNLNEKLYIYKDQWHFWSAVKFNLANWRPRRYNAILAFKEKEYEVQLQHESRDDAPKFKDGTDIDFGTISLSSYYRDKSYTIGFKGSYQHW